MPIDLADLPPRFVRDEEGAVAVITALVLTMLMGFVAFGVDTASLYRDRAELQATADLSAMSALAAVTDGQDSAARDPAARSRATAAITRNGRAPETLGTLTLGRYSRDPSIPADARFTAQAPDDSRTPNAVRVALSDRSPLHFARVLTDESDVAINGLALASRTGAASFSLGGYLARLDGVALEEALSNRLGARVSLSAADIAVLEETSLDLAALLESVRSTGAGANPAEVLNQTVTDADILRAALAQAPAAASGPLQHLADAPGRRDLKVSALVSGIDTGLGLTATDFLAQVDLSAADLLRGLIGAGPVEVNPVLRAALVVPGVTDVRSRVIAGEPPAQSRWIALGERGTTLHRAGARIETVANVAPGLVGLQSANLSIATVRAPVTIELGGVTATLEHLACGGLDPDDVLARFSTSGGDNGASIASVYLGEFSEADRAAGNIGRSSLQFSDIMTVNVRLEVLGLPVQVATVTLQARAATSIGTSQSDEITFTRGEIARGEITKTFVSGDVGDSVMQSLLGPGNLEIRVSPDQASQLDATVGALIADLIETLPARLLQSLSGPLDALVDGVLADSGHALGVGELTLTGHHCELIRLVR